MSSAQKLHVARSYPIRQHRLISLGLEGMVGKLPGSGSCAFSSGPRTWWDPWHQFSLAFCPFILTYPGIRVIRSTLKWQDFSCRRTSVHSFPCSEKKRWSVQHDTKRASLGFFPAPSLSHAPCVPLLYWIHQFSVTPCSFILQALCLPLTPSLLSTFFVCIVQGTC